MGKYLIFGGNQFVGQALAQRLLENGHEVYVLNRGNRLNPNGTIELITDRNDEQSVQNTLSGLVFDAVYDVSAYFPEQTRIAVECLLGKTEHFIHISTAAVYANVSEYPIIEDNHRGANENWGDYAAQKYLCEEELFRAWNDKQFPITIFRPFYIYGSNNNLDRETYIFKRLLHKMPIVIPGRGNTIVQFGYIADLLDALLKVVKNKKSFGEAYNISGNSFVTFKDWVEACSKAVGRDADIICVDTHTTGYPARAWFPFRDTHMFGSCEKLKRQLSISPTYSLARGLRETYDRLSHETLLEPVKRSEAELNILKQR